MTNKLNMEARLTAFAANSAKPFWNFGSADAADDFLHQAHALAGVLGRAFAADEVAELNADYRSGALRALETLIALGIFCVEEAQP